MSNLINPPHIDADKSKNDFNRDVPGEIAKLIGSGKHAQAAIVWQTIKFSFLSASVFSVLIFLSSLFISTVKFEIQTLITIWSIFVPLITLSLGYLFGKGKE